MRTLIPTTDFPPKLGGISTLAYEQAVGLAALGEQVRVDTLSGDAGTMVESSPLLQVRYQEVRTRAVLRILPLTVMLDSSAAQFRPDFIASPTYRAFGVPIALVCWRRRIPYSIYIHGTEINTEVKSALRRRLMFHVLNRAAFIATNSQNTRRLLLQAFPALHPEVVPILPGVHFERFAAPEAERAGAAIRKQWLATLPASGNIAVPVILLSLCRMSLQKGVDVALRTLAQLVRANPQTPALLVAAGSGPDLDHLKGLARDLGVQDRVLFTGAIPYQEIPGVLRAADVYVQPSQPVGDFIESFGISFVEAQASGLPCIGTNWGGVPEAVASGRSAILVPTGSTDAVADALTTLIENPELRSQMAACGKEHAQGYSWDVHVQQLLRQITAAMGVVN